MNTKAKSAGSGSRGVVASNPCHQTPSVSGATQGPSEQQQSPNGHPHPHHHPHDSPTAAAKTPRTPKEDSDKSLDDLESTLDSYFTYIGAKISDVATAGTAPKDQVDPSGKNTCQVCGQANSSWFEMRKHMRTHSDFRPYKCNMCPRSFHDMYKLKRHLVVHTGLKPYQCHICDQRLSRAEHLRRHLLIHKEIKPFKCSLCDFSARRTDSVKSHQRSKHVGEWVQVVTVRSIVDIVSDETTTNTNLTPPIGKKKKKKKKQIDAGASGGNGGGMEEGEGASGSAGGGVGALSSSVCQNLGTTPMQGVTEGSSKSDLRPIPGIASLRTPANLYGMAAHAGFPYPQALHQQHQQQAGLSPGSSGSSKLSTSSPSPSKVKTEGAPAGSSSGSSCTKYLPPSSGTPTPSQSSAATPGSGLLSPPPASVSATPGQSSGLCPSLHPVMTMAMDPASQAAFNLQAAGSMNYYPGLPGQYGMVPGGQTFSTYFAMKPVFPEAMPVNHHHHPHHPHAHHHAHPTPRPGGSQGAGGSGKPQQQENSSHSSPVNMSYGTKMGSPNS